MISYLPFGNPWGYRFHGAFGNGIQSTTEVDQLAGFLYLWTQILSDFIHQADIKSLNSAKSRNNLIPVFPSINAECICIDNGCESVLTKYIMGKLSTDNIISYLG